MAALQPLKPKALFTNASGQVVTWGSMVLPFVKPGTRFTAVAAGSEHNLAIKEDGTVVAWGRNASGEATVPSSLTNVIAVSAGGRSGTGFSAALRRDGTIIAWGNNSSGQTNVPSGLSDVIAISAGADYCLALKKDGTVIGWGSKSSGKTQAPADLSNVVAIAAAGELYHALPGTFVIADYMDAKHPGWREILKNRPDSQEILRELHDCVNEFLFPELEKGLGWEEAAQRLEATATRFGM